MQDFINMICTRICHDIISSSQGILQGVESLEDEDPVFVEQAKFFIKDSAQVLNAKLVFFRALCGRAGKLASVKEVQEIGGKYLDSFNKKVYDIEHNITGQCEDITLLKTGLGLCCIAVDTLIKGGNIALSFEEKMLFCKMKGFKLKLHDDIYKSLIGEEEKFDPKSIIASYLNLLFKESGYSISINISEQEIIFIIK